jgi:tRNA threonylcarbamoyladenosine biosynthesis protein TsaE
MEIVVRSEQEMRNQAAFFVKNLLSSKGYSGCACIIGLRGDLGSGKTTFVRGVARALGVRQTVTSPTFVVEKVYKLKNQPFNYLIHIDAYRLEKGEELLHLGWEETSKDPKNLIFVEWPENVEKVLPPHYLNIEFQNISEKKRKIKFRDCKNLDSKQIH